MSPRQSSLVVGCCSALRGTASDTRCNGGEPQKRHAWAKKLVSVKFLEKTKPQAQDAEQCLLRAAVRLRDSCAGDAGVRHAALETP